MTHEDFERAVSSLSSAEHAPDEPVRELVRIARDDAAHRDQALAALEGFVAGQRGRPGYRSEPVLRARTALYALDPKRTARTVIRLEGIAALLLAVVSAAGALLGGTPLARLLISVAALAVLLTALSAARHLWQPYVGAWAVFSEQARWARGTAVVLIAALLTKMATSVPATVTEFLLYLVVICFVGWALWLRQPRTARRS